MIQRMLPTAGEFYRHFKGNLYQIIGIAKDSETEEKMVVYQALYGDYGLYVRPLEMFLSPVDKTKYPKAEQEFRFEKVMPGAGEEKGVETKPETIEEKKPEKETKHSEEETENVRPEIIRFLDAEGAAEKLEVLRELRNTVDEALLTTMELSLDLLPDEKESPERRYELIERTLEKRVRFEGGRLR